MNTKELFNIIITFIKLFIVITIIIIIIILGLQILYFSKEINKYYNQQEYNISINILNIQLLQNMSTVQEQEILNQIYNKEVSLINNFTINNG